jgi:hypothetical protein
MCYVYVYLDPRKPGRYEYDSICFLYQPIYVGKGTKNRMFEHIKRSDNHPLTRKISKIKSIFQVEYFKSFIFKIQDSISHNEAF